MQNTSGRLVASSSASLASYRTTHKIQNFTTNLQVYYHLAPAYISELISSHPSARSLRSFRRFLLTSPTTTSAYGDHAFSVSAPKLWNILPTDIKVSPNVRNVFIQIHLQFINSRESIRRVHEYSPHSISSWTLSTARFKWVMFSCVLRISARWK